MYPMERMGLLNLHLHKPHHRRQDSLEKTIILGKCEGIKGKGRPNVRWVHSVKEVTILSLQELRRDMEYKAFWRSHIHRVTTRQRR